MGGVGLPGSGRCRLRRAAGFTSVQLDGPLQTVEEDVVNATSLRPRSKMPDSPTSRSSFYLWVIVGWTQYSVAISDTT